MTRLGVDLVSIKRFRKIKKSDYRRWRRIFTLKEWNYAFKDVHSAEHLAGMFAAKEAAVKASGAADKSHFLDWEVKHLKSGAPELQYQGKKNRKTLLSISHDGDTAVAIVVLI